MLDHQTVMDLFSTLEGDYLGTSGRAHVVIVIIVGNGHGNMSSNSRWGWLHSAQH